MPAKALLKSGLVKADRTKEIRGWQTVDRVVSAYGRAHDMVNPIEQAS